MASGMSGGSADGVALAGGGSVAAASVGTVSVEVGPGRALAVGPATVAGRVGGTNAVGVGVAPGTSALQARAAAEIAAANSAMEAFETAAAAGVDLGQRVVDAAWRTAAKALAPAAVELETVIFDRAGGLVARSGFRAVA